MQQSRKSEELKQNEEQVISRRDAVKGGLGAVVGAFAAMMAARRGSAAVTPMDVKRGGFTQNAVTPMDRFEK